MTLGKKLEKWREANGLTQREAAQRAGISQPRWNALENDRAKRIGIGVARGIVKCTRGAITLDDLQRANEAA